VSERIGNSYTIKFMSIHIIIDGYNLIRRSSSLSTIDQQDIQLGREALLDTLASYKRIKRHKITVVFDGTNASPFALQKDRIKGIKVKFSRNGETADTVIKRMAAREREKALVVSSDLDIVNFAASMGAATISLQWLFIWIQMDLKAETGADGPPQQKRKARADGFQKENDVTGSKLESFRQSVVFIDEVIIIWYSRNDPQHFLTKVQIFQSMNKTNKKLGPQRICVIDGQGGGIGSTVIKKLKDLFGETVEIIALGTNAIATAQMLKARANRGASGENAIENVEIVGVVPIPLPHLIEALIQENLKKII